MFSHADTRRKLILPLLLFSLVLVGFGLYIFYPTTRLPALYTEGNKIMLSSTHQPIILQGVTSQYFRYSDPLNVNPPTQVGLENEFKEIESLKNAGIGINLVSLYFSNAEKVKENIQYLDRYVASAQEHGLYVLFAPTGNAFQEVNAGDFLMWNKVYFKGDNPNDLSDFTEFLSARYAHYSNVLYQLTAEPNLPSPDWETKEGELAAIIRRHTDNPIILSTRLYTPYSPLPVLPVKNLIYSTGGYIEKNDHSTSERTMENILGSKDLQEHYPVMVVEFGGNYGGDFSSEHDLSLFKNILDAVREAQLSYSVFMLHGGNTLSLFDRQGNLTEKGKLMIESLKQ